MAESPGAHGAWGYSTYGPEDLPVEEGEEGVEGLVFRGGGDALVDGQLALGYDPLLQAPIGCFGQIPGYRTDDTHLPTMLRRRDMKWFARVRREIHPCRRQSTKTG